MKPSALRYLSLFFCLPLFAAMEPSGIPRLPSKAFFSEGLFTGGEAARADLDSLRLGEHAREGYERWVVDFTSEGRPAKAPRFQIEYVKAEKFVKDDGTEVTEKPAKFIFRFQSIHKSFLTEPLLAELQRKSRYVKEIVVYPPVEQGDMAMELVLKDDVRFSPFEPIEREGRLVLDMKAP